MLTSVVIKRAFVHLFFMHIFFNWAYKTWVENQKAKIIAQKHEICVNEETDLCQVNTLNK